MIPVPPPPTKPPRNITDTECYWNLWSIGFIYENDPGTEYIFGMTPDWQTVQVEYDRHFRKPNQHVTIGWCLPVDEIKRHLYAGTTITFNGDHYDQQMIAMALCGADVEMLKKLNDHIIVGGLKPWEFYDLYGVSRQSYDHVDLYQMSPAVKTSLKKYAGRNHAQTMQELPYEPTTVLNPYQAADVLAYMGNDMRNTLTQLRAVDDRLALREEMNERFATYGVDFRSRSDAQMAETAFKAILNRKREQRGERWIEKAFWQHGTTFRYTPPPYIRFQTPQMQQVMQTVLGAEFIVSDRDQCEEIEDSNGEKIKTGVIMPKQIKDLRVLMGNSIYRMGIGGLHSCEQSKFWVSSDTGYRIKIADVTSYYPSLILNLGIYPSSCGPEWTEEYRNFFNERVAAKAEVKALNDQAKEIERNRVAEIAYFEQDDYVATLRKRAKVAKTKEGGFKIFLNGSFGKLGSKYSILYAPDGLIRVTLTGQLSLLMLIESLELAGIPVISANTDGIVATVPVGMEWVFDSIMADWETRTHLNMEVDNWQALFSRDVNNYIGFEMPDEKGVMAAKCKGVYAKPGLTKDPSFAICATAVREYLGTGKPIEQTIRECRDITQFVAVRNVKGGAVKNGEPLGKVVRWAYAIGEMGTINYLTNGNRVPKSEGARPLMNLPKEFPDWIDHAWYSREAYAMLAELGVRV